MLPFFRSAFAALKPGCKFSFCISLNVEENYESEIQNNLILAGFEDIKKEEISGGSKVTARKPNSMESESILKAKQKWSEEANNDDAAVELTTENELLKPEDLNKPVVPAAACGTEVKKKACKNCTCGLAEIESKGDVSAVAPMKSSCGNVK